MNDMEIKVILEEANVRKDFFTSDCKENKLKCPFCQQELEDDDYDVNIFGCVNQKCDHNIHQRKDYMATKDMWEELIRTRKELEQSETCCTEWEKQALDYKAENIGLSGELERTRKALDVAIQGIKTLGEYDPYKEPQSIDTIAQDIIEQITALEQRMENERPI